MPLAGAATGRIKARRREPMMAAAIDPISLIDEIYEAPFLPERWSSILQKLAHATNAEGGILSTLDGMQTLNWVATDNFVPHMQKFMDEGYQKLNIRPQRSLAKRYAGFLADVDVLTEAEIASDAIYQEIMRPAGIGWAAASVIPIPSGDLLIFEVDRKIERGPFDKDALDLLDTFRPHLARAGLMAARLHIERAGAAAETMARLGLPTAAIDARGRVVAKNDLLDPQGSQIGIGAQDRLLLANAASQALFEEKLKGMAHNAENGPCSIPIPASDSEGPAVFHLVPIRRMVHDIFQSSIALAIATPLVTSSLPQADLLGGLFDLSPAEDRVARGLMDGLTVQQCAENFGVSYETVRGQLKNIFAKTATSRQSELLQLLANTSALPILR